MSATCSRPPPRFLPPPESVQGGRRPPWRTRRACGRAPFLIAPDAGASPSRRKQTRPRAVSARPGYQLQPVHVSDGHPAALQRGQAVVDRVDEPYRRHRDALLAGEGRQEGGELPRGDPPLFHQRPVLLKDRKLGLLLVKVDSQVQCAAHASRSGSLPH